MNLSLEREFSKAEIFERIDELKLQIDAMRPLSVEIEGRVMQKLRLDWNYNSNAIEGNKLNYGETTALLMHGVTAKGKPLKDHLDIQGHNAAIDFLLQMVQDGRPLTETDIRGLHEVILGEPYQIAAQTADGMPTTKLLTSGEYKKLPNHVKTRTGEIHYYATPEETPAKMNDLMQWYNSVLEDKTIHPIVIAALFHHRFVAIHPFDDGNGRMTRILMNLILMRSGYPVAVIKNDDKNNYYSLLSRADNRDLWPFVEYIAERVESSLLIYNKAINGQGIEENDDIDKELALFKIQLNDYINVSEKKTSVIVKKVVLDDLIPLFNMVVSKTKFFNDFFFNEHKILVIAFSNNDLDLIGLEFPVENGMAEDLKKAIFKLNLYINFNEFKNETNNFSVNLNYEVVFEDYRYTISIDGQTVFSNYYNIKITDDARQKFVKYIIMNLKEMIQEKLDKAQTK
jgi:Fic family protein